MSHGDSLPSLEPWLTARLQALYPDTDQWVVEGVSSASVASDDATAALDTISSFLGRAYISCDPTALNPEP